MPHESNALRTFCVLVCCAYLRCVACQLSDSTWSMRFGGLDLFNMPTLNQFGAILRSGQAYAYNMLSAVEPSTVGIIPEFDVDPDIIVDSHLTTPELVERYGYPSEIHHVVTEDGYILEVHRIAKQGGIPVLLTHGLLDSSATWVLMGPNKGLGYLLYDLGYDVWMTNMRGNTYSRNHTKYTAKHAVFWDFSFHEMGVYDLPASIDYVLQTTGHEQLHYIGHSQGTTVYWVMCSERPQYTEKVMLMQALAPVAYLSHCKSPVVDFLAFFGQPLNLLLKLIGTHEFLPNNDFMTMFSRIVCEENMISTEICSNVIFLITGFDKAQTNETMLPVVLGHSPAGSSTKQMQHFAQLRRSGHFRQYDYGWIRNHWRYGSVSPPEYKLENVLNKVALHYSQNDWLAQPEDVDNLYEQLPNGIGKFLVNYSAFNHLDFVWAVDVRELLYKQLVRLMDLVEQGEI